MNRITKIFTFPFWKEDREKNKKGSIILYLTIQSIAIVLFLYCYIDVITLWCFHLSYASLWYFAETTRDKIEAM